MTKSNYAIAALPALLLGMCATAAAVEPSTKPMPNQLRITPFVAGKAESKAAEAVIPKNEKEAIARKRTLSSGIVGMQLPEDRMSHLVRVTQPDGTVQIVHEGHTPAAVSKPEVK